MLRRSLDQANRDGDGIWFEPVLRRLREMTPSADGRLAGILLRNTSALVARAPGRLDIMGGISDYSGSLVLELPLECSTFAVLQARSDDRVEVASLRVNRTHRVAANLQRLTSGDLSEPAELAEQMRRVGEGWAAYVLGVVQLCARLAGPMERRGGFSLLIHSEVPEGKGVSSSAALEIATMAAVSTHLGLNLAADEMAAACQWVENHVVGAPCGQMDQLTSTLGRRGRLLRLRCQPAVVEGHAEVPEGYRFFGIDSGLRHAVAGADYVTVRAAAFMGYRILAEAAGLEVSRNGERVQVEDSRWGGYLANVSRTEFGQLEGFLPDRMLGEDFLRRFGYHTDPVTRVRPDSIYPVRAATRHPILENRRVERFARQLAALGDSPAAAAEMGRLMFASHESYGECGLGSAGTDRLVTMVREAGSAAGVFGAKITGGGSGGTVAVFGRSEAEAVVREVATRYAAETGKGGSLFLESGPGAEQTGVVEVARVGGR